MIYLFFLKRKKFKKIVFLFILFLLFFNYLKENSLSYEDFMKEIMLKRIDLSGTIDQLNDLDNQLYNLNPESICRGSNRTILFIGFVVISPKSWKKRNTIRTTWADKKRFSDKLKLIFTVGMSDDDETDRLIEKEFNNHGDILQLKFLDSYQKITRKVMLSFKWISKYCPMAKYVLRINDDAFVNTFALIDFFEKHTVYKKRQIYGWLVKNSTTKVSRKPNDKFLITKKEYALEQFPDYPSGKKKLL